MNGVVFSHEIWTRRIFFRSRKKIWISRKISIFSNSSWKSEFVSSCVHRIRELIWGYIYSVRSRFHYSSFLLWNELSESSDCLEAAFVFRFVSIVFWRDLLKVEIRNNLENAVHCPLQYLPNITRQITFRSKEKMKISNFLVTYLLFSVYCEGCIDTNGDATDSDGYGCDSYNSYPSWCGFPQFDTSAFTADVMCCACGGGGSLCVEDEHVFNHTCVVCLPGSSNLAGDDYSGQDTFCDCIENYHVVNHTCVACSSGQNLAGDDPSGQDTFCDCIENYHVVNHTCVACLSGNANPAGDDPSGWDTFCDECIEDYHVVDGLSIRTIESCRWWPFRSGHDLWYM